jgi:hypothetical protein
MSGTTKAGAELSTRPGKKNDKYLFWKNEEQ